MRLLTITFLFIASFILGISNVFAHTIKSDVDGVQLWAAPDPTKSSHSIRSLTRMEEFEVLESVTDRHGKLWFKVLERSPPKGKRQRDAGWVAAKYFSHIVVNNKSTEAGSLAGCANCLKSSNRNEEVKKTGLSRIAIQYLATGSRSGFIRPAVGPIRSGFGMRRHPILGTTKLHDGTDIASKNRSPVYAAKAGTIIISTSGCSDTNKSCNKGSGNMVSIDHGDGTMTKYLHLSWFCRMPKQGAHVEQGEKIACVGSSGASTGPHLHFGVSINGKPVNPIGILPRSIL